MNGDKIMFEINGHTKQLGIIGYPVEHTFSPNMHNFISETVHNNYVYGAWCVKPEDLKDAIGGMRALGISGINVTAPHKVEVMKYIDVVTDRCKKLGSVNTVVTGTVNYTAIIQTRTAFVWHLQKPVLKSKTAEYL